MLAKYMLQVNFYRSYNYIVTMYVHILQNMYIMHYKNSYSLSAVNLTLAGVVPYSMGEARCSQCPFHAPFCENETLCCE